MTLDYCLSQGHYSFVFVVNFEKVYSFDCYSYFPNSLSSLPFIIYYFNFMSIVFIIISSSVVIIISVFFLPLAYFVCSVGMVVCFFYVRDKNTLLFIFYDYLLFCHWLCANILCIVVNLIHFRFKNFINFDTDRLYNFFL